MNTETDHLPQTRGADVAAVGAMMKLAGAPVDQALDALSCDIEARPAGAPHFLHVHHALLAVRREPGALVIDYDPAVAPTLERVVDAERTCCAGLDWQFERVAPEGRPDTTGEAGGTVLRLRVAGTPEQLDVMQLLFEAGGTQRPTGRTVGTAP
jgi:hypothetical protein